MWLIVIVALNLILISLMAWPIFSREISIWWIDNLINLQFQWSLLAIILMVISVKQIQYFAIPLTLLYSGIIFFNFSAFSGVKGSPESFSETLKIAQLNIKYENPNLDDLIGEFGKADYDVILVQEIGDKERDRIKRLVEFYPFSIGPGPLENYPAGMALFSRWPIVERKIHRLGYVEGEVIEVVIQSPMKKILTQLITLHPGAPRTKELWKYRNMTLDYASQQLKTSLQEYKIIIGDFNISPWSTEFKKVIKTGRVKNTANGYGYIPSWSYINSSYPARLITSAFIGHCLISGFNTVVDKSYQFVQGSDHALIVTELGIE